MRHRPRVASTAVDRRWARVTAAGLALILLLTLAVILLWRHGSGQDHRLDRTQGQVQDLNNLASAYASAAGDGKALAGQIKAACTGGSLSGSICASASSVAAQPGPATTTPAAIAGPPRTVLISPSLADMARAVSLYCAAGRCSQPPTPTQVQAAFATWCAGRGGCRGPAGRDGKVGKVGKVGAAGVSVTGASQDVAHHLILAFSDGTTVDVGELPAGPTGSPGPPGQPGQNATPQPFSFSYTVPGVGPGPDRTYTTSCRWDPTSGYDCTTEES